MLQWCLQVLALQNNSLSGTLKSSLAANMTDIILDGALLLARCTCSIHAGFAGNLVSGSLPTDLLLHAHNLGSLLLNANRFSGSVSAQIFANATRYVDSLTDGLPDPASFLFTCVSLCCHNQHLVDVPLGRLGASIENTL